MFLIYDHQFYCWELIRQHSSNSSSQSLSFILIISFKLFFTRKANLPFFGLPSRIWALVDQLVATFICGNSLFKPLCALFLFIITGFDYPNLAPVICYYHYFSNYDLNPQNYNPIHFQQIIPFTTGHFPDETSMAAFAHWAQRVVYNTFSYYDYGIEENLLRYGTAIPPIYNLSKIDSENLMFISGINDWLADPDDVDILRSQLIGQFFFVIISYKLK